jgi:NADH-quinone oxidoreductase subunit N
MYFDEPKATFIAVPNELNIILGASAFLVVTYYFTVGSVLTNWAHIAAGSLF